MYAGVRIFRVPGNGDVAARDSWLADYLARCAAAVGETATTPQYERPWEQAVAGGVACAVDTAFEAVEQPGDPPLEANLLDGWGVDPDNPLGF
jgi:hypothetical protein